MRERQQNEKGEIIAISAKTTSHKLAINTCLQKIKSESKLELF